MIVELRPEQFGVIKPLIANFPPEQTVAIVSVIKRNTRGRIFVDDPLHPKTALVWVIYCMFYFLGDPENPAFNDDLHSFFKERLIPMNEEMDCGSFIMTLLTESGWKAYLDRFFHRFSVETGYRLAYYFDEADFIRQAGISGSLEGVHKIDETLKKQENSAELIDNICEFWPSLSDFLKRGVGYYLLEQEGRIASACFSVAAADPYQEIVINTYEQTNRKKGYGSLVARAFINECLEKGAIPVWNAYETNIPSVRIAKRMGFKVQERLFYYEFPFVDFR